MRPVRIEHRSGKGMVLVHCCEWCGHRSVNRVAVDDPAQPDAADALGSIMMR
jgi:hypothetical protein